MAPSEQLLDPKFQDLLQEKLTEHLYRVCWRLGPDLWLIGMTGEERDWPKRYKLSELQDSNTFRMADAAALGPPTQADPVAAAATYQRFKVELDNIPNLLTPKGRSAAFARMKQHDSKLSKKTFYKVVWKWLAGGCIPSALGRASSTRPNPCVPTDVHKIAYADALKQVRAKAQRLMRQPAPMLSGEDHTRRGKPRKNSKITPKTLYQKCPATLRVFMHFFAKKKGTPGMTVKQAYEKMRDEVFADVGPTGMPVRFSPWVIPSLGTFSRDYYEHVPHRQRRAAITGEHDFELNQRAKVGQSVSAAFLAGAVGQLDATVWNVNLVSEGDFPWDIGPPVVFRVRCKNTGQLLGLSIGLEAASWNEAGSALMNCLEDKQAYCAKQGVAIARDEWNTEGLPPQIDADCGETYNNKPNRFILRTGVSIVNVLKARGDLKGGVESDFFKLQVALNGMTPGALIKQYEESHQTKWRVKGSYTLRQFTQILIREELKQMRTTRPTWRPLEGMAFNGVDTSPASVWRWASETFGCAMRRFDLDNVKKHVLEVAKGAITDAGLKFRDLLYVSDAAIASDLFSKARLRGFTSVSVAFDPRLVDTVYLIDGDPEGVCRYEEYRLNIERFDQRGYAGKSFKEVALIMQRQAQVNHQAEENNAARNREHTQAQAEITKAATARVKKARAATGVTVADLKKEQPAARMAEQARLSPGRALVPALPSPAPPQPVQVSAPDAIYPPPSVGQGRRARLLGHMKARSAALQDGKQEPTTGSG